jgi:hypothetical protein
MHSSLFAVIGQPLFGSMWLAALTVCAAIALLMVTVALAGRWLAATHPDRVPLPRPLEASPVPAAGLSPETLAIIASAVNITYGPHARISAILPTPVPSVEALMLQWGLEGRRQIYTSHKVR